MVERKQLKITEVERLENTSFATVFAAGVADIGFDAARDADPTKLACSGACESCWCPGCNSGSMAVCCSAATCGDTFDCHTAVANWRGEVLQ